MKYIYRLHTGVASGNFIFSVRRGRTRGEALSALDARPRDTPPRAPVVFPMRAYYYSREELSPRPRALSDNGKRISMISFKLNFSRGAWCAGFYLYWPCILRALIVDLFRADIDIFLFDILFLVCNEGVICGIGLGNRAGSWLLALVGHVRSKD